MEYIKILDYLKAKDVALVAVSKTKSNEEILDVYNRGQRDFGENKVQELVGKYEALPKDIRWHMIGHLQKNKAKMIAPFVHMIHSVDSMELIELLDKLALDNDRIINILLQVKIAEEDSKYGISPEDLEDFVIPLYENQFSNLRLRGLMGMATFTDDEVQIGLEFHGLCYKYLSIHQRFHMHHFDTLSMGMSGDYQIAIEEGSNMVRIGSLIFGSRAL